LIDQTIRKAAMVAFATPNLHCDSAQLEQSVLAKLTISEPDGSVPPELLSPPASREPSPARLRTRAQSPGRWRLIRTVNNALKNVLEQSDPGVYGPFVLIWSFSPSNNSPT
jgi:hypothetical protein